MICLADSFQGNYLFKRITLLFDLAKYLFQKRGGTVDPENSIAQILSIYHYLLMLDDNDDKEKSWLVSQVPESKNLSTSHFHILSYLLENPEALAKQVSGDLEILRGTLSKRLRFLVDHAYVEIVSDRKDGRIKRYRLTNQGIKVAQKHDHLLHMKNQYLTQKLNSFDTEELQLILHFLQVLKEAEETISYPALDKGAADH